MIPRQHRRDKQNTNIHLKQNYKQRRRIIVEEPRPSMGGYFSVSYAVVRKSKTGVIADVSDRDF